MTESQLRFHVLKRSLLGILDVDRWIASWKGNNRLRVGVRSRGLSLPLDISAAGRVLLVLSRALIHIPHILSNKITPNDIILCTSIKLNSQISRSRIQVFLFQVSELDYYEATCRGISREVSINLLLVIKSSSWLL